VNLPTKNASVNIGLLHPQFRVRLARFFADPEIAGRFKIGSGVRTQDHQRRLYIGWIRRIVGYNLAANPDRVIGTTDEGWTARGSWHMQQEDGWGYAIDTTKPWWMSNKSRAAIFDRVAPKYGLARTVPSESWHLQPRNLSGWFHDPSDPVTTNTPGGEMLIIVDVYGPDLGQVFIVGGEAPIDITDSPAKDKHVAGVLLSTRLTRRSILLIPPSLVLLLRFFTMLHRNGLINKISAPSPPLCR